MHKIKMGVLSVAISFAFLTSALGGAVSASGREELDRILFKDAPESAPAEKAFATSCEAEPLGKDTAHCLENECRKLFEEQEAPLFVELKAYGGRTFLIEGELYVSPVELFGFCDVISDEYDDGQTVCCTACGTAFSAYCGDSYAVANGRYIWCPEGVVAEGGKVYVPLSCAAAAVGMTLEKDEDAYYLSGEAEAIESGGDYYDGEDLYWLSRIISAESKTESLIGKIAVGNVVLNRVASPDFPCDVYGVVFDRRFGTVQFSPVAGGSIYSDPDDESIAAAKLCLEGVSVSDSIMYFMNPDIAATSWISDNRDAVITIGNHTFYS